MKFTLEIAKNEDIEDYWFVLHDGIRVPNTNTPNETMARRWLQNSDMSAEDIDVAVELAMINCLLKDLQDIVDLIKGN